MKLKKICFVTNEYNHPDFPATGGIGIFIRNLSYELRDKGIEVYVFSYLRDDQRERLIDDNGVIIYSILRSNSVLNKCLRGLHKIRLSSLKRAIIIETVYKLFFSMQLYLFALKNKIDIFEFNDFCGDSCFFLKRNVVVRCHGNAKTLHEHMGYPKSDIPVFFEKIAFKFHKNIVCVSEYCKDTISESFDLKVKPQVIYNSVKSDYSLIEDLERENRITKSIFFFGSLRERKGLKIACLVVNRLIEKFPEVSFHIIGKNEANNYENICLNLLSSQAQLRTKYYGAMKQSEALINLKNAHVVIFPSFGENFSLALLETMALGKIVVTSNIPSFNEVIVDNENGFLANSEDEYVQSIQEIFLEKKNINIEQIEINAYNTIVNNFDNRILVNENIKYYESILN